ncbi:accessory factor UbiK family protein [Methylobacterium trifolii]|uniref:Ubiquinone biosynthesis accessory factor UbiK n=1 Tax=Methylobacterium trifolii TaxID=1003092 RepID=A0ABQ4TZI1_9HYPH|nr:accessory factor UbiK family protein [Methylobacterium trifolii]GJE60324.1 Ubiquinone biosynthesis accessory factor UbiK [Methylobacterium trifolii]
MPPSNRLFDDLSRLMTDAAGAAQGVRREAETVFKAQVERLIRDMDIASREEVDVLRDLVSTLRTQNDALAARVAALEAKSGTEPGTGPGTAGVGTVI